jgi:hypothetical protein
MHCMQRMIPLNTYTFIPKEYLLGCIPRSGLTSSGTARWNPWMQETGPR